MTVHNHFLFDVSIETALNGEYHAFLVLLSYLVAVLAGFCALSVTRFVQSNESIRMPLLLSGGVILGLGVWSMHFTAMLAFSLPIPVLFEPKVTLISVLPAILASVLFLNNVSRGEISNSKAIYTGLFLAVGIATMHFVGMSAMSMKAYMLHDPIITLISVLSSWGLAVLTVALITDKLKLNLPSNKYITFSAVVFGFSVATMHYLAMASTYFFPDETIEVSGVGNVMLTTGLLVLTVFLMALLILFLFYKERISGLLKLASTHHKRVIETIDNMQDGFVLSNDNNEILLVNKNFQEAFGKNKGINISVKDSLSDLYEQLAATYFTFDETEGSQKMLDIVNSKTNLVEPFKVLDKEQRWWLLRQNRTSADTIIQTWTDVTAQIAQENELKVAKNTALETLDDLRETQDELLETKKMASLGGVVSGVAHELNTPLGISITSLSSIKEVIEQIQASLASGHIKKSELESSLQTVCDFEEFANKSLDRMAKLIQQFKYISVDQEVEVLNGFSLMDVVDDATIIWKTELKEKNITLNTNIENNLNILGFENALTQVLSSFMSNSIEHAFEQNKGGEIHITGKREEDRFTLVYSDNGSGIEPGVVNRIFEPFVTTKRNEGGVGLGLHIAYNLVTQKLKGKIKLLEPSQEYSTIFTINLPIDHTSDELPE